MINTSNKSKLNEIHMTNERDRRDQMHHLGYACWRNFREDGKWRKEKQRENEF